MAWSQVMAGMEMPVAATDKMAAAGLAKAGKTPAQTVISDFKKKLESLSAAGQPATMTQETVIMPGQDHSMAKDATAQSMPQGVVGILEGFGLLDYQADISAAQATQSGETVNPDATQQAQMSGQFARMLNNEQPGGEAQNAQVQTNAGAEEYSGSLESTSRNAALAAEVVSAEEQAVMLLKSKMPAEVKPPESGAAVLQGKTPNEARASAVPAQTAQAAPMEGPRDAAGEPTLPDTKADVTADVSQGPGVNTGSETAAGKVRQAQVPAETAEPQKTVPDFVKDNVIRIVDKASTSVSEGRYEFDVDLKPDFLGKVSIKLTMENGEVRMHVKTHDAAVKGLFSDQSGPLQSALKERGIIITTVDVSYQEAMTTGHEAFGQQAGGNGQRKEGQIGWSTERYSGDLFDAAAPVAELLGGSSVEYLA